MGLEGSSDLQIIIFCGFGGCCLSFCWFGFGGRRLCEPGRPGCNRARAESVPANSTTENRKTLKSNAGRCFESTPLSPQSQRPSCLLGGSLSRGPIVGGSLLRGPTLELREHRLHVFCVFLFPCGFTACFLPRLPAKTYSTSG